MATSKPIIFGLLTILVLAGVITVMNTENQLSLEIANNQTWFINNGTRIAVEYTQLKNGTALMTPSSVSLSKATSNATGIATITRTITYPGGAKITEKYLFNSTNKNVEAFPVEHTFVLTNAKKLVFEYHVNGLHLPNGPGTSPVIFGKYRIIYSGFTVADIVDGNLIVVRDMKTASATLNARLFDPVASYILNDTFDKGGVPYSSIWTVGGSAPTVEATIVHGGNQSIKYSKLTSNNYLFTKTNMTTNMTCRIWVYYDNAPTVAGQTRSGWWTQNTSEPGIFTKGATSTANYDDGAYSSAHDSGIAITTGAWINYTQSYLGNGTLIRYINGVKALQDGGRQNSMEEVWIGVQGGAGEVGNMYFDDFLCWNGNITDEPSPPASTPAPTFVAPSPSTGTTNNTQVNFNITCSAGNVTAWFGNSTQNPPTRIINNNASPANWSTNVTVLGLYNITAGCNLAGVWSTNTTRTWIYNFTTSNATFISPTPANNTFSNVSVYINTSCVTGKVNLWFDTNANPITLVINNQSSPAYYQTPTTSIATYRYKAGCFNDTSGWSGNTTVQTWNFNSTNIIVQSNNISQIQFNTSNINWNEFDNNTYYSYFLNDSNAQPAGQSLNACTYNITDYRNITIKLGSNLSLGPVTYTLRFILNSTIQYNITLPVQYNYTITNVQVCGQIFIDSNNSLVRWYFNTTTGTNVFTQNLNEINLTVT